MNKMDKQWQIPEITFIFDDEQYFFEDLQDIIQMKVPA